MVDANLGSSEVRSRDLILPTQQANVQSTRYLGTEITDHTLVYDQEYRYLGTEITGYLQNTTNNFST